MNYIHERVTMESELCFLIMCAYVQINVLPVRNQTLVRIRLFTLLELQFIIFHGTKTFKCHHLTGVELAHIGQLMNKLVWISLRG